MDCLQKCHSRVCFSISNNFTLSFFLLTYPASCVQSDEPCRWASIWPLPSCPSLVSHPPLPLSLSLSCDIEEMRWMGSMSNPAWGAAMDLLRWLCAITLHLRCWLEQAHRLSILNHGDFVITSISWRRDLWGVAEVGDMVAGGDDATDGASLILKSGRWWGDDVMWWLPWKTLVWKDEKEESIIVRCDWNIWRWCFCERVTSTMSFSGFGILLWHL